MKRITYIIGSLIFSLAIFTSGVWSVFAWNFESALEDSINTDMTENQINLNTTLERRAISWWMDTWAADVRDFIARVGARILIPVLVLIWVIVAIIGFYKMMTAKSDEDVKKANNFILRWTIGVIIMVSAWFIINALWGTEWTSEIFWSIWISDVANQSWAKVADDLYVKIMFPFIKIALYFVVWILFVLAFIAALRYIFNPDAEVQRKSILSLVRAVIGIIVIILAKELVETVYWPYAQVVNQSAQNIWEIWDGLLEQPDLTLTYTALNRALWLVMFIIVIIIIYQWYLLLTKPNDEETMKNLTKNLGYIFIWILIIGAGYLIANFFIIK